MTEDRTTLPKSGTAWDDLKADMLARAGGDVKWRDGKLAVYIFHAGDDVMQVSHDAYGMFISENGLGPLAFPSLAQMEQEVINMGLSLLNAPETGWGSMTSGGSESIYLAVKACRDQAKAAGKIKAGEGEILIPLSAHPAFDKAAKALELKLTRTPLVDPSMEVDVDAMAGLITDKTIMIVGSAPNFPFGVVDPIPDLSDLALARDVWLHVDACVGGYFAPFAERLGVELPAFDFRCPGVKSISADLHKYGYAAKGASTVFHRTEEQGQFQTFTFDAWPGGHMYTPNMAGTRPGGAIAAAWAVMNYLGEDGYLEKTQAVLGARKIIEEAITVHNDLQVLGDSRLGLIAYGSDRYKAGAIMGGMMQRGWFSAGVSAPKGVHLMLSPKHLETAATYVDDLKDVLSDIDQTGGGKEVEARYS